MPVSRNFLGNAIESTHKHYSLDELFFAKSKDARKPDYKRDYAF